MFESEGDNVQDECTYCGVVHGNTRVCVHAQERHVDGEVEEGGRPDRLERRHDCQNAKGVDNGVDRETGEQDGDGRTKNQSDDQR